jgi:hypothetical protein
MFVNLALQMQIQDYVAVENRLKSTRSAVIAEFFGPKNGEAIPRKCARRNASENNSQQAIHLS